jgi:hypothetical protein
MAEDKLKLLNSNKIEINATNKEDSENFIRKLKT